MGNIVDMKSLKSATALAFMGLLASAAALAHTKAEIENSADRALTHFYTLNHANWALVGKAAGVLGSAIAVVSQGSGGQYDSATLGNPILGFIFNEKGLIGDLSLEGTKVTKIKTTD
jgi:hypothetical protein